MSSKAILDAGFLVAYFDKNDTWHQEAVKLARKEDIAGVVLDCVLNEVFSVLCRRSEQKGKSEHFGALVDSINGEISQKKIVWAYTKIRYYYHKILSLMKEHQGKLNFHDCLIALIAQEKNIEKIISFDQDFDNISWLERISRA